MDFISYISYFIGIVPFYSLGNELERALRKIGREDVIRKCMYNVEEVTDVTERNIAQCQMDQDGEIIDTH